MAEPGNQDFPTTIGADASFKGELTFEKGLRLMGRFEGKINTPGRLHIAREAKMQADVDAGAIVVEGDVRGNLTAATASSSSKPRTMKATSSPPSSSSMKGRPSADT